MRACLKLLKSLMVLTFLTMLLPSAAAMGEIEKIGRKANKALFQKPTQWATDRLGWTNFGKTSDKAREAADNLTHVLDQVSKILDLIKWPLVISAWLLVIWLARLALGYSPRRVEARGPQQSGSIRAPPLHLSRGGRVLLIALGALGFYTVFFGLLGYHDIDHYPGLGPLAVYLVICGIYSLLLGALFF